LLKLLEDFSFKIKIATLSATMLYTKKQKLKDQAA